MCPNRLYFGGLKALCSTESNTHIKLYCYNTLSCAYLQYFGWKEKIDIWNWCISGNIHLSVPYVAGLHNMEANDLSRKLNDDLEWI